MSNASASIHGAFCLRDSGIPASDDYTTLIIIHGFGWHSGVFARFFPLAAEHNARIILVNRRDYPGSAPISEEDRNVLASVASESMPAEPARKALHDYLIARSRELYQFLVEFVNKEMVTPSGGLVLAAWSFGCSLITALLADISSVQLTSERLKLRQCIKRVVLYDPPYHAMGYQPPPDSYNPLFDASLALGEGPKRFPAWISGYYNHGDSAYTLEHRNTLPEPRPTILTMSALEVESALYLNPTLPGGSDDILLSKGIQHGIFTALREQALYVKDNSEHQNWSDVELSYIWCDHSVWEMPWCTWAFQAELDEAKRIGRVIRKVTMTRLRGANHFYHWDMPELALRAILSTPI
ncbi:alpha/beta-hydrolase [Flammula alnicola]|nr:alpha/beta-hydrolase [Flammula alnicola]